MGITFLLSRLSIKTSAFNDNKIGNVSPIGDAVAMLPPMVPTFRI